MNIYEVGIKIEGISEEYFGEAANIEEAAKKALIVVAEEAHGKSSVSYVIDKGPKKF